MQDQIAYQDFDLLIEPGSPGGYRARVLRSPAGESTPIQFSLPFSALELENFVLKVGQGRRRTRGISRPESAPLKEFGGKLYNAVFRGEVRDALDRSLIVTRAQRVGLRLRLRLTSTPELADVPWEFLYDPRHNRFLALSRHTPLVRYLDLPAPPRSPLAVDGPLRLLVMISNPTDYPPLDVEQEWRLVTGALAQQVAEGRVILQRATANMVQLRAQLRREAFHIFHFVGHGQYRPDWGDGVLVMEDRNGRPQEVTGEEIGGLLHEYDATRLAVLNACEGARSGASDPSAGMAQSLIRQGLPVVVAMQFEITDDAATIFAHELYGAIADGYPLEAALAEARGAIRDEGNSTEWGIPVLYSRVSDGHLFDFAAGSPVSEAKRLAQKKADRQAGELAVHYEQACTAADAQDWDQALSRFTMIADVDPGYRDVQERIEDARKRQQIASLHAEVRRLYQAAQWAAVVEVGQRLRVLDPTADNPDGLVTSAQAQLAPQQPTKTWPRPRMPSLPAPQARQVYEQGPGVSVFEVAIGPGQTPGVFGVSVSSSVGEASAAVGLEARTLLARRPELQQAVLASAVDSRAVLPETERSLREVGQVLFAAMLGTGEVAGRYRAAAAVAAERGQELRVVLRIDDPVLAGLPWESMYDEAAGGYVCRRDQLVRHVPVAAAAAPLMVDPPLRILGVISSPLGLKLLDVDKEQSLLEKALSRLAENGLAEVVWAPSAVWADLQDALLGGNWHVLHFIGHGDFDPDRDEGVLALTGEDGRRDLVEASRIVDLLRQARPMPRLVVLNSCSGAAVGATDLFSGTAAALVRGGVSAVAAMQYAISDPAAVAFARGFYSAIAHGRGVDDAVSSGRVAIVGLSGLTLEWVTPVLYLRGHESRLFTLPAKPPSARQSTRPEDREDGTAAQADAPPASK